jgi:hypothetical protein
MTRLARAGALAAGLLLAAAFATAQAEEPHTYRGTVYAVRPGALDLITGVGYALRLVHIRTPETTVVARGSASLHVGELKPGDVVRADCRLTDTGLDAERLEQRETR